MDPVARMLRLHWDEGLFPTQPYELAASYDGYLPFRPLCPLSCVGTDASPLLVLLSVAGREHERLLRAQMQTFLDSGNRVSAACVGNNEDTDEPHN